MAAKRILTSRAAENMVVADDVYTTDDKLVIPEGTVLTEEIIKSLKEYGIFAIRIKVDEEDGSIPLEDDSEEEETKEIVETPKRRTQEEQQNYLRQIAKSLRSFTVHLLTVLITLKVYLTKLLCTMKKLTARQFLRMLKML